MDWFAIGNDRVAPATRVLRSLAGEELYLRLDSTCGADASRRTARSSAAIGPVYDRPALVPPGVLLWATSYDGRNERVTTESLHFWMRVSYRFLVPKFRGGTF
jgi:hypothetical protein